MVKNKIRPELRAYFMPDRSGQVINKDGLYELKNAYTLYNIR